MSHYSTVQCKVQTAQMSPLTVIFPAVMVAFVIFSFVGPMLLHWNVVSVACE